MTCCIYFIFKIQPASLSQSRQPSSSVLFFSNPNCSKSHKAYLLAPWEAVYLDCLFLPISAVLISLWGAGEACWHLGRPRLQLSRLDCLVRMPDSLSWGRPKTVCCLRRKTRWRPSPFHTQKPTGLAAEFSFSAINTDSGEASPEVASRRLRRLRGCRWEIQTWHDCRI